MGEFEFGGVTVGFENGGLWLKNVCCSEDGLSLRRLSCHGVEGS